MVHFIKVDACILGSVGFAFHLTDAGLSFYKSHISIKCPAKHPRVHSRGLTLAD